MAATKVLVVDDSLTMRALISGALERIPNVEVVGLADGAEEARALVERLRPDVMTLDVEMPGISGLQYLAELMEVRPMPVIMFSTRTAAGAQDTVEALRLGAIECFPKPKVAVPAELEKIIAKLGKCIKAAKGATLRKAASPASHAILPQIEWNGRVLAIGGDAASTKTIFDLLGSFPANCPPTIVVQHLNEDVAAAMVGKLDMKVAARVVMAEDGMAIEQGSIYYAPPGEAHLVVDGSVPPRLRLLSRDPVAGARPSISVLFASLARSIGADTVGLRLNEGDDGTSGLDAMATSDGYCIKPNPAGGFDLSRKTMTQAIIEPELARMVLKLCSR